MTINPSYQGEPRNKLAKLISKGAILVLMMLAISLPVLKREGFLPKDVNKCPSQGLDKFTKINANTEMATLFDGIHKTDTENNTETTLPKLLISRYHEQPKV